jgi:hypothetical protein
LNRVNSSDPSRIAGQLTANGNIILINPNGVFFDKTSVIDVNGLIATTANINTEDFMNGDNHLDITGNPEAAIINQGHITAKDSGLIGLVAPNVENSGVITARLGRVQLASGDTVVADFYGDGLLNIAIEDDTTAEQIVKNTGKISAEGGQIAMTAAAARQSINSLITVEGELKAPAVTQQGGKIIIAAAGSNHTSLTGDSRVSVQADLDVSGRNTGQQGGEIEILGDRITLAETTIIDASGHSAQDAITKDSNANLTDDNQIRTEDAFMAHGNRAGGSIKIGGDYLGSGDTQTAKTLTVEENTLVLNSALQEGDGGRTIFWSDMTTDFNGLVIAQGGAAGGHGGFLETSGKENLRADGFAFLDTQHEDFDKGLYLLDPNTIKIVGNVDDEFQSTDGSIDLPDEQVVNIDFTENGAAAPVIVNTIEGIGGASSIFQTDSIIDFASDQRTRRAIFSVALAIDDNSRGTIFEAGGSNRGSYVGFQNDGTLVFHAGSGGGFSAGNASNIQIAPTDPNMPRGIGVLSWDINPVTDTLTAYWNSNQIGQDTAASDFDSWTGNNSGALGDFNGHTVRDVDRGIFTGQILSDLKYYDDQTIAITSQTITIPFNNNTANTGILSDFSGGSASYNPSILNGNGGVIINDNISLIIDDSAQINTGNRGSASRLFTFETDSDVTAEQILYAEGDDANGMIAYIENSKLHVGIYNDDGSPRAFQEFNVVGDEVYHLSAGFDAATNNFTATLNGEVKTGNALGIGTNLKDHDQAVLGANISNYRDENGNTINQTNTVSKHGQFLIYDRNLSENERAVMEQYQATKYDFALQGIGTGSSEIERATAADGYGVFTTDYLEYLSGSADIMLRATNDVTLDLQGDTLALDTGRSISLISENGDITDISTGIIQTDNGNITLNAIGGDVIIDETEMNALNGGRLLLNASGEVNLVQANRLNLGNIQGNRVYLETRNATSDITLNGLIEATGTGNAMTLNTGRNFINNAGVTALNVSNASGRWLVYSANPAANTLSGLNSDFELFNRTFLSHPPASITESGDGFIYSSLQPPSVIADVTNPQILIPTSWENAAYNTYNDFPRSFSFQTSSALINETSDNNQDFTFFSNLGLLIDDDLLLKFPNILTRL